jgi:hypothetical protein
MHGVGEKISRLNDRREERPVSPSFYPKSLPPPTLPKKKGLYCNALIQMYGETTNAAALHLCALQMSVEYVVVQKKVLMLHSV